jgi:hypothetical protein
MIARVKVAPARHRTHPWRVHTLARDFRLLDVWEVPVESDRPDRFDRFYALVAANRIDTGSPVVLALLALRAALGRVFRWDEPGRDRPIPGCAETMVAERLTDADRARSRAEPGRRSPLAVGELRVVYQFEDEALVELSNATVHALLHFSWAPDALARPRLAVYVKARGASSHAYLALIEPFRRLFVYPAWIARIADRWDRSAAGGDRAAQGDAR